MKMAVALYMIDAIKEIVCVRWLCICVVFRFWLESCSSYVMIVVVAFIFSVEVPEIPLKQLPARTSPTLPRVAVQQWAPIRSHPERL